MRVTCDKKLIILRPLIGILIILIFRLSQTCPICQKVAQIIELSDTEILESCVLPLKEDKKKVFLLKLIFR